MILCRLLSASLLRLCSVQSSRSVLLHACMLYIATMLILNISNCTKKHVDLCEYGQSVAHEATLMRIFVPEDE